MLLLHEHDFHMSALLNKSFTFTVETHEYMVFKTLMMIQCWRAVNVLVTHVSPSTGLSSLYLSPCADLRPSSGTFLSGGGDCR